MLWHVWGTMLKVPSFVDGLQWIYEGLKSVHKFEGTWCEGNLDIC